MRKYLLAFSLVLLLPFITGATNTNPGCEPPQSDSGIGKVVTSVPVDPTTGMTVEQKNVADRLKMDNKIGSIKHLYVISPYSGQCILYSTVKGKVTSSGKRLSPRTSGTTSEFSIQQNANSSYSTNEVLEDDGTYGDSCEYIYWWDTRSIYHQLFMTGSVMVILSDQPMPIKSVTIDVQNTKDNE